MFYTPVYSQAAYASNQNVYARCKIATASNTLLVTLSQIKKVIRQDPSIGTDEDDILTAALRSYQQRCEACFGLSTVTGATMVGYCDVNRPIGSADLLLSYGDDCLTCSTETIALLGNNADITSIKFRLNDGTEQDFINTYATDGNIINIYRQSGQPFTQIPYNCIKANGLKISYTATASNTQIQAAIKFIFAATANWYDNRQGDTTDTENKLFAAVKAVGGAM